MTDDSARLRRCCATALEAAYLELQANLAPSNGWSPLSLPASKASSSSLKDVEIHVKRRQKAELFRAKAVLDDAGLSLRDFLAVLQRPEVRDQWDPSAIKSQLLQTIDAQTQIRRTELNLGWPAQGRDVVTVARNWSDDTSLIYLEASISKQPQTDLVPLRLCPPFVRAIVMLSAWVIEASVPNSFTVTHFISYDLRQDNTTSQSPAELFDIISGLTSCVSLKGPSIPALLKSEVEVSATKWLPHENTLRLTISRPSRLKDVNNNDEPDIQLCVGHDRAWAITSSDRSGSSEMVRSTASSALLDIWTPMTDGAADCTIDITLSESASFNGSPLPITRRALWIDSHSVHEMILASRQRPLAVDDDSLQTKQVPAKAKPSRLNVAIKRSYTYFASLMQEPEAKWRPITESKGVSVAQLNSIDPTVAIYRAVATLVGTSIWDLCSVITNGEARLIWERNLENVALLQDIDDLSSLWHIKTKAVWPSWSRESIHIRTVYKAPTSIHIFSFQAEEDHGLPVPICPPQTLRTSTIIQGWALEILSPTTCQVTLIEQTDSKGWSNRSWTYNQMLAMVAGVGDFAIKSGAPPVLTRTSGVRLLASSYQHDKGLSRIELGIESDSQSAEIELRLDLDIWAASVDVTIDPLPTYSFCSARRKVSALASGCWLALSLAKASHSSSKWTILVRKGSVDRPKGSIYLNGSRLKVDTETLAEADAKALATRKRSRLNPMPLDQPVLNRSVSRPSTPTNGIANGNNPTVVEKAVSTLAPALAAAAAALQLSPVDNEAEYVSNFDQALRFLALLQQYQVESGPQSISSAPGWTIVSQKNGLLRKRIEPELSESITLWRADKVYQNVDIEALYAYLAQPSTRAQWDGRCSAHSLDSSYGHGCFTSWYQEKQSLFQLRPKSQRLLTLRARFGSEASKTFAQVSQSNRQTGPTPLEGWVVEGLDSYANDNYPIHSVRVSLFSFAQASDWGLQTFAQPQLLALMDALVVAGRTLPVLLVNPSSHWLVPRTLHNDRSQAIQWSLSAVVGTSVVLNDVVPNTLDQHILLDVTIPTTVSRRAVPHIRTASTPFQKLASPKLRSAASLTVLPRISYDTSQNTGNSSGFTLASHQARQLDPNNPSAHVFLCHLILREVQNIEMIEIEASAADAKVGEQLALDNLKHVSGNGIPPTEFHLQHQAGGSDARGAWVRVYLFASPELVNQKTSHNDSRFMIELHIRKRVALSEGRVLKPDLKLNGVHIKETSVPDQLRKQSLPLACLTNSLLEASREQQLDAFPNSLRQAILVQNQANFNRSRPEQPTTLGITQPAPLTLSPQYSIKPDNETEQVIALGQQQDALIRPQFSWATSYDLLWQPRFSLISVAVLTVMCFLLGSFLRSLLSPVDFILDIGQSDLAVVKAVLPSSDWRYARRLLEIRLPLIKRSLIIASSRRS